MKRFDQVVVIGYGVVTGTVLSHVYSLSEEYGYGVDYIEHEIYPFNSAKKYAENNNIKFFVIEEKTKVTEYFRNILKDKKVLIISASNNYIFPEEIVESDNCTIINFHNALLPNLPGRNAPSWAIYEEYEKTGITWHYVTCNVDEGDIIVQRECSVEDNIKAYELVAKQMELAGEAFIECFENILKGKVLPIKQPHIDNRRLYKSKEIPGNGFFSLDDNPLDIYRLLRAVDYGKNGIFPCPKTIYNDRDVQIRRYKIVSYEETKEGYNKIFIPLNDEKLLMLKFDNIKD